MPKKEYTEFLVKMPAVRAQKYRVISKIRDQISERIEKHRDKINVAYSIRPSLLIDSERYDSDFDNQNLLDACFFLQGSNPKILLALVILGKENEDHAALEKALETASIPLIVESAECVLDEQWILGDLEKVGLDQKVFGAAEAVIFKAAISALWRVNERLAAPVSIIGQVNLASICPGFSGLKTGGFRRPPTDVDLLFITDTPVSLPVLGIEVDGPHHWEDPKQRPKDLQKDAACERAGIPLIRIRVNPKKDYKFIKRNSKFISDLFIQILLRLHQQGFVDRDVEMFHSHMAQSARQYLATNYIAEPAIADSIELSFLYVQQLQRQLKDLEREWHDRISDSYESYSEEDYEQYDAQWGEDELLHSLSSHEYWLLHEATPGGLYKYLEYKLDVKNLERPDKKSIEVWAYSRFHVGGFHRKLFWKGRFEVPDIQFATNHKALFEENLDKLFNEQSHQMLVDACRDSRPLFKKIVEGIREDVERFFRGELLRHYLRYNKKLDAERFIRDGLKSLLVNSMIDIGILEKAERPQAEVNETRSGAEEAYSKGGLSRISSPKYYVCGNKKPTCWDDGLTWRSITFEKLRQLIRSCDEVSSARLRNNTVAARDDWEKIVEDVATQVSAQENVRDLGAVVGDFFSECFPGKE